MLTLALLRRSTLLLAFLLGGCVHLSLSELDPKIAQSIKRIAVISVAGDRLFQVHEGVGLISSKLFSSEVEPWGLDIVLADQLVSATQSLGKYDVVLAQYDRPRLTAQTGRFRAADIPFVYTPKWRNDLAPLLREIAQQNNVDTIELLMRFQTCAPGSSGMTEGYGVYWTSGGASQVYSCTVLFLIDGRTGESIVGRRPIDFRPKESAGKTPYISVHPTRKIPTELAKTELPKQTPDQQAALRAEMLAFIADSHPLDEAVRELFGVRGRR